MILLTFSYFGLNYIQETHKGKNGWLLKMANPAQRKNRQVIFRKKLRAAMLMTCQIQGCEGMPAWQSKAAIRFMDMEASLVLEKFRNPKMASQTPI